ncbi:hypothetical protein CGC20_37470 [Leishmania donovani]|uniref:Uncharacterized protein n=1 Tax=Leishmania donovani TaxID=5661 RepID=A0A504Y4P1_LEIDO|nr:hypothetical protein CGC20_37470 [Leishmania donovani]
MPSVNIAVPFSTTVAVFTSGPGRSPWSIFLLPCLLDESSPQMSSGDVQLEYNTSNIGSSNRTSGVAVSVTTPPSGLTLSPAFPTENAEELDMGRGAGMPSASPLRTVTRHFVAAPLRAPSAGGANKRENPAAAVRTRLEEDR